MPTDHYWTKIFSHSSAEVPFSSATEAVSNPQTNKFSALTTIDSYKNPFGQYHLKLVYPEIGKTNEWYQISSPVYGIPGDPVFGYEPKNIELTGGSK